MNVQEVYVDGKDFLCYRCGNCGTMSKDRDWVEACCKPVTCVDCGREIPTDKTKCREYYYTTEDGPVCCDCHIKRVENSWPVITEEEYWKLKHEENSNYGPVCDEDTWYDDLADAIESLVDEDWWETAEDLKQVKFQVGEILKPVQMDIDKLIEWETENLNLEDPDCGTIWNDLDGLYKFMEEWNKKQTYHIWDRRNMWVTLSDQTIKEIMQDAGVEV